MTWDCDAYGPEGRAMDALCFFADPGERRCGTAEMCRTLLAAERRRVFDRIGELATDGDPIGVYLAGEFTHPEQLLGGTPPPADDNQATGVDVTATEGPDAGHLFRISVTGTMSFRVVGEPHHADADWESEPWTVEVRAWSLPEAMRKAAELPLTAWGGHQLGEPVCGATTHHPCPANAGLFGGQHRCDREPHPGADHRCRCGAEWAWLGSTPD